MGRNVINPDFAKMDDVVLVITRQDTIIFDIVNFMIICGIVAPLGIAANTINSIIFYKQGFTNTVNIAFLGLAISDLCCLIAMEWSSICMNPFLPAYDTTWISVEVMYLSAAWPHVCFCRITSYITVYITAERFLSIALPLKVKQIVTVSRTATIICLIYIINMITFTPEYATSYLGWRFVSDRNKTLIGIIFTSNRNDVEGLSHMIHAFLSTTSFVAVVLFTCALVFKLRKTSDWRKDVTSGSVSQKERKTVKMVVLIACLLIICYTPASVISMVTYIIGSEFNVMGKYLNICEAVWSIAWSFQSINSSINIFLYYRMSSKYRQTFIDIFMKDITLEK